MPLLIVLLGVLILIFLIVKLVRFTGRYLIYHCTVSADSGCQDTNGN